MSDEFYNGDCIECPYCGHRRYVKYDTPDGLSEDTVSWECGECAREFNLRLHVSYTYVTSKQADT